MVNKTRPPSFTLRVDSNPKRADVFLNGQPRGTTPCTVRGVRGPCFLRLTLPDHQDHSETLDIRKHETVCYTLMPSSCTLTVGSSPKGAAVYLNNQLRGSAPTSIDGLKSGRYSLKVTLAGFRDYEATVNVAGLRTEVSCTLVPLKAK